MTQATSCTPKGNVPEKDKAAIEFAAGLITKHHDDPDGLAEALLNAISIQMRVLRGCAAEDALPACNQALTRLAQGDQQIEVFTSAGSRNEKLH